MIKLGIYGTSSTFKIEKPRTSSPKSIKKYSQLIQPIKSTPSIPNKFQSNGYEFDEAGQLEPQDPVIPYYDGTRENSVGPADYNPNPNYKYSSKKAYFSKVYVARFLSIFNFF